MTRAERTIFFIANPNDDRKEKEKENKRALV